MERCTIVVVVRDRFSTTVPCLQTVLDTIDAGHEVIFVGGGVPPHLQEAWRARFGGRVRWLFEPAFVTPPVMRNLGLRAATTRLAAVLDNDVFVRPGWLEPLIRCQQETGAAIVAPLILEAEQVIHTAGNRLYINYERGRAYGHKDLCFNGMRFSERCSLTRERTDYGEPHGMLLDVQAVLRMGGFDDALIEANEVDLGLAVRKAGREVWFEPESVVRFAQHCRIRAEDIPLYVWRWEIPRLKEAYAYFERKWGFDISEYGGFRDFLFYYNSKLGLLPRLFPSELSLSIDRALCALRRLLVRPFELPKAAFRRLKRKAMGYDAWPAPGETN